MPSAASERRSMFDDADPRAVDLLDGDTARQLLTRLTTLDEQNARELGLNQEKLARVQQRLALAEGVKSALEGLSRNLFKEQLDRIQEKLTIALQEVLDQPIQLRAEVQWKRDAAAVDFHILRDGNIEHIVKGQGGSVANTVSVGLRLFALVSLDPKLHRRTLVLDEQDCWLRPDLVPRLVKIVHDAGHALGFQVIMVSHHDVGCFQRLADCIYRFESSPSGAVRVQRLQSQPNHADPSELA